MLTVFKVLVGAALGVAGTAAAAATERGPLQDRFTIDLGVYAMESDTTLRADEIDGIGIGTDVHLEDVFGFDDEDVFRLEGAWRFHKRHKLRLMYFESNRTASNGVEEDFVFSGTTFPVGLTVTADFDFQIIELAYQYDFLQRETYEIGASIGIHNVDFGTRMTATVFVPGSSLQRTLDESVSTDAPLPVIGLRGNWNFAGNFYLQAHAQYFQVKYEGYDGSIQDYQAGVLWQFSRHFGVGASYNLFDTRVDIDDGDDFQGRLDWQYDGAQLYFRASF
jgi:hypothetical protein